MPKTRTVRDAALRLLRRRRPLPYAEVAARINAEVPGARATARSVASVACALRREGADLPDRRLRG